MTSPPGPTRSGFALVWHYRTPRSTIASRGGSCCASRPASTAFVGRRSTVSDVRGVTGVDPYGGELTIRTADGASALSPVAVALNSCDVEVRDLSLRTPTLDDVFLEVASTHMREGTEHLRYEDPEQVGRA